MRTRLQSILVLALTTSCAASQLTPTPATTAPPEVSYDTLVRTARSYVENGKAERAAELCAKAAAMSPDRPDAYVTWGLALAQLKQLDQSAAKYEAALARGGKDREVFVELASVYDVSRRYEEAVRVYRHYLSIAPDDVEMRQELGLTLVGLERTDEAVLELRACAAKAPGDLQVMQDLGYALLHAKEAGEAATILAEVVAKDANRPEAMQMLARARATEGKAAEALAVLDRLLKAWPDDRRGRRIRARLRLLTDNPAGATEDYRLLISANPDDSSLLLGAAGAFIALGRLEEADQTLDHVRQSLGSHPLLEFREAQIAWRRGKTQALISMAQFARDNPNDLEAWREVAAGAKKAKDKKLQAEAAEKLKSLGDLL